MIIGVLLVFLAGCGDKSIPAPNSSSGVAPIKISVPTKHSLHLGKDLFRMDAFADGKLLYAIDYTDPSVDQPSPDTLDMRYYLYDTSTRQTVELGKLFWSVASNDNSVYMDNGKVYLSFDDYGNNYSWIKILEIDMHNNAMDNRLIIEADNPTSNLAKISDTEFIYNIGQGINIRNFSFYIFNTQTNTNTLFLTMQYDPDNNIGKVSQRARKFGEYIYVLVEIADGTDIPSNVLEKYSLDGKLVDTIPLPDEINPYIYSDGEYYGISDFDIRGDQYYFYSDGTGAQFFYTQQDGKFVKQTSEYGWGILYPESNPQYIIYDHLYRESCLLIFDLETGETTECRFNIDSEYNQFSNALFDSSGKTDQIALICTTKNPDPNQYFEPQYQAYFMNFSDILTAIQQAQA